MPRDRAEEVTETAHPERSVPKPLIQTTGRRKEAVARVRLRPGTGVIKVNGRTFEQYFPTLTHRVVLLIASVNRSSVSVHHFNDRNPRLFESGPCHRTMINPGKNDSTWIPAQKIGD